MKIPKQAYTHEFKELAVGRVKLEQSIAGTARELGFVEQQGSQHFAMEDPLRHMSGKSSHGVSQLSLVYLSFIAI